MKHFLCGTKKLFDAHLFIHRFQLYYFQTLPTFSRCTNTVCCVCVCIFILINFRKSHFVWFICFGVIRVYSLQLDAIAIVIQYNYHDSKRQADGVWVSNMFHSLFTPIKYYLIDVYIHIFRNRMLINAYCVDYACDPFFLVINYLAEHLMQQSCIRVARDIQHCRGLYAIIDECNFGCKQTWSTMKWGQRCISRKWHESREQNVCVLCVCCCCCREHRFFMNFSTKHASNNQCHHFFLYYACI